MADQAVIFAADSALRALSQAGVQADFAVSVDVAKTPDKCLPDSSLPARVVLSANSPPGWSDAISVDHRYYLSSNQLTLDWLDSVGLARTKVAVSENCGATAIDLARFLGCSPICVFGMDLALSEHGPVQRHHRAVESSVYTQSGFNPDQSFPRVPGNFSPDVPTHVIGDWRALDRRLATWPADLVWVVTDRGARLRNTTPILPDQFTLPPATLEKHSLLAGLPPIPPPPPQPLSVASAKLEQFGASLASEAPALRQALDTRGLDAITGRLRTFLSTPEYGLMLGAYSLKLMPQLLPPIEQDATHWLSIINELESLGHRAVHAAKILRKGTQAGAIETVL
jgi:hypothetical protein